MTFALGARSLENLVRVHPALIAVAKAAIELTPQDFSIDEGVRSLIEEEQHVADDTSRTLNSKHLLQPDGFGHAVDAVPFVGGKSLWALPASMHWTFIYPVAAAFQLAAVSLNTRIRWGGCWDRVLNDLPAGPEGLRTAVGSYCARHEGPDFLDGPHFEIAP